MVKCQRKNLLRYSATIFYVSLLSPLPCSGVYESEEVLYNAHSKNNRRVRIVRMTSSLRVRYSNIYFYYFMQICLIFSFCHYSNCNFTETLQILRLPPPTCEHYCDHFVAFHSKYLDKSASALFQPLENEWKNVIVIKAFFLIIISFYIFIYLCVWCIYSFKPNNVLQNTGCHQQYLTFNQDTQHTSFSIDRFKGEGDEITLILMDD